MILAVCGSPRKKGNTDLLLRAVAIGAAGTGVDVEPVHLADYVIRPCDGCEGCRKTGVCVRHQDGMQLLYPKVRAATGLVLGSCAYNYNVTPWMKIFIDRLYCFYDFTNDRPRGYSSRLADHPRLAAAVGVCEQADVADMGVTMDAMALPLKALGYEMTGSLAVTGHFDRGSVKNDDKALADAARLGRDLAERIRQAKA